MGELFNTFLYEPFLNALVLLYQHVTFQDLGLAVILLTVLVRVVLWPLFHKMARSQAVMQRIQPEMQKIQKECKDDKAKQAELMMALYRKHKINPFSGIFLLAVQIPIIIALYRVFLDGFSEETFNSLYSFVPQITEVNSQFIGIIDLAQRSIAIAVLAAVVQYWQGKMSMQKMSKKTSAKEQENPLASVGRNMVYIAPGLTLVILWNLPAVVGVYWFTTSVFSVIQQAIINKKLEEDDNKKD